MLLNIVTDEELLVSEVVKTILLILIAGGVFFNLRRLIRNGPVRRKILSVMFILILCTIGFFVGRVFILEYKLLNDPQYVKGVTTGYCSVFALGKGVEFEYEIDGKKYRNCNTFYPVPIDSIIVPGGQYEVRFATSYEMLGRMNFQNKTQQ